MKAKKAMKRAWEIRKEAARNFNCTMMEIVFAECLRQAWREIKMEKGFVDNEGKEGFNPKVNALEKELDKIHNRFWSVETTKSRRIEWNALVKSGKIKKATDVATAEKKLGWTTGQLMSNIRHHNL